MQDKIDIPDELIARAKSVTGKRTTQAVIRHALEQVAQPGSRQARAKAAFEALKATARKSPIAAMRPAEVDAIIRSVRARHAKTRAD
jgi:hypothetical protein